MAISDEDASDEESCQPARRRRKVNFTKTNEKGETRLHRACIEGHLKSVEVLIKQGHLINPRDFCGWIPLHEACNHGYIEIVKFLLKHGAHINDRGGKFCDNITPINDAATNGHFDVVEELLDHGADPNIANAQGRTTLDSLICYYQQYKEDLDKESKKEYKKLYARLKSVNNHSVPPRESNDLAKKTFSKTNPTPHNISDASALVEDHLPTLIRETKKLPNSTSHAKPHSSYFDQDDCLEDIDTDSSSPPPSPLIRKHVDGTRSKPVRTNPSFVSAFDDVSIRDRRDLSITKKRRNKVDSFSKRKMATPSSSRNALIAEDQRVDDDDDWLVPDDDTYFQPIKKHRSDGYLPRVEPSLGQCVSGKVPTDVPSTPDVVAPSSSPTQKLSQPPPVQSAVRVKVRVEDKAFVFAVPKRENTIAWLRDKTSSRYEEITSQKPILSLTTSDGCLLSPEDSICDVLNNNDLVIGQVESWCCISISQRYSETCVKEDQPVLPEITNACELSENTKVLQLENYGFLFRSHLKPLISSLGQQELHKISLPGNRLDEEGVTYMCDVLQLPSSKTKTSLTELNLTCCGIMGKALACIARCEAFHRITRLNLSFNPLFDSRYVEELLANMKSLESLTLRGCLLSGVLFDDVDPPKDGLQCLEHLDISKNNLGHSGVEKWLRLLNRSRIKRIIVQKVTDANDCNQLIRSLAKFIKESETKLMLIDAAGNNFSEEELSVFASVKHLVEEVRF